MSAPDFAAIAPVVIRYAEARLRCPDLQAVALVLAWYYWHNAKDKHHQSAIVWARCGVRAALAGRDLPGVRSRFRDAWDRLDAYQGTGMGEMADRRPGPLDVAIGHEEVEQFYSELDDFEREMCDLLVDGVPNGEVARRLNRTPGAISQRRRKLMERYQNG